MSEEREQLMLRLSEIADHLQTSLAASPIPDVEGRQHRRQYAPGGDELEHVGGDWYDAVRTPDGRLACVVGDVMGRGVRAATTMIRVRAGIRGLLTVDSSPDVVLVARGRHARARRPGAVRDRRRRARRPGEPAS